MKKLVVNADACVGCGACVYTDPEHFEFNDNGVSHAISQENIESESVQNAIQSCPTCAISIEDECDGNCEHCEKEGD